LGLTSGLATLTQFYGGFILLPAAAAFYWQWGSAFRRKNFLRTGFPHQGLIRQPSVWLFGSGFLLLILPYSTFILAHLDDFIGQSSPRQARLEIWQPAFYVENVLSELERWIRLFWRPGEGIFGTGVFQPLGPWFVSVALVAAVFYLVVTVQEGRDKTRLIPWLSLFCFTVSLALFEQTKAAVYTFLLVPGLCLALAAATVSFLEWVCQTKRALPVRLAAVGPVLVLLALLIWEGAESHHQMLLQGQETTPYPSLAGKLRRL
jgi:hypothetical protein